MMIKIGSRIINLNQVKYISNETDRTGETIYVVFIDGTSVVLRDNETVIFKNWINTSGMVIHL